MRPSITTLNKKSLRNIRQGLTLFVVVLAVYGGFKTDNANLFVAYFGIVLIAALPLYLWIGKGMLGIPVLPAVAIVHILYYAIPMLKQQEQLAYYDLDDKVQAAYTVSLFLLSASIVYSKQISSVFLNANSNGFNSFDTQLKQLALIGIAAGVLFWIALISGWISWLGSFYGVVRSVFFTLILVSCYCLGVARGKGILQGADWRFALACLVLIVLLSWSSLFLVLGLLDLLTFTLGLIITSRRIPWTPLIIGLVIVSVLHAGKEEMRDRYWGTGSSGVSSVLQIPSFFIEWFGTGLTAMAKGSEGQSLTDRASLLNMLLQAQVKTPALIDYLYGETYALLPPMLVPRFINPDKPVSQAAMNLLNIRYGLMTEEGTQSTAIGWGLIAEAWVNFGYFGVISIGALVGYFTGALNRWSVGQSALSLPTLYAIAAMTNMSSVEQDLTYLCTILFQSFIAVLIFLSAFKLLLKREKQKLRRSRSRPAISSPKGLANTQTSELSRHSGMDCRNPEHREVNPDCPPRQLGSGTPPAIPNAVELSEPVPSPNGGGLGWGRVKLEASLPVDRPPPGLPPMGGGVNSAAFQRRAWERSSGAAGRAKADWLAPLRVCLGQPAACPSCPPDSRP